jgi:hypothetical protein
MPCVPTAPSARCAGASSPRAARPCWWWPTYGKGETYTDLACGLRIGTSTVYRYVREALTPLAAMAPTLEQAIEVASRKAFVIVDGTLPRSTGSAWPAAGTEHSIRASTRPTG